MKHTTLFGKTSDNTSVVLRYSDETETYEIYSPWKDGKSRPSLRRKPDVVPYAEVTAYTTYVEADTRKKSGIGRAAGLGILFGPAGAVVGAVTGRAEFETVKQISIAIRAGGSEYILPLLYAPMKGEKAASAAARRATDLLAEISAKLESTGAAFDASMTASI